MMRRAGSTLVELLVTLVVMGIIAGAVTLAVPQRSAVATPDGLTPLRRSAIATRRPVSATLAVNGREALVTAYPDGSVLADTGLGVDRLSGAIHAKR